MEHYKILVSEHYHQDVRSILSYMIHDLKAPVAAANFLDDVEETVHGLKDMPDRLELVKDETLRNAGYRKCTIKDYLLFYKVFEKEKTVRIYRLIYGRRNWQVLL